ncbi:MAG: NAD(P)-dependent oxidoreductase [Pseudomonadales bacterium]|nr:NAD(P)-dependent oxidoreductase [Pseudomonadales bacterium]
MPVLEGKRILITGPAGQIAFPLAARLARNNEVWGIARFSDPAARKRCEEAGIRTRAVDLADPDWSGLPEQVDYLLHLAAIIEPGLDYDRSIRINAEGTGRCMARFREAEACLVMSTCGVYASPADGSRAVLESDPLGGSLQPYAPTYCISKIAQEAVARFAAAEFGLPTTIARMNAAYGDNGGLPAILLEMILAEQPIAVLPDRASIASPIHEDDIFAHTPALLDSARVPATIVNWGGDEPISIQELSRYMARRVGKDLKIVESSTGIHQYRLDPTRRIALAGPCSVAWKDGVDRMIMARHPGMVLR